MLCKEKLRELATCPVCLDLMKEPKMLHCQHTFCQQCIQKFISNKDNPPKEQTTRIRCAQCRAETAVPKSGYATLPGNIYLQSILDLLASLETEEEKNKGCSGCRTLCDTKECRHCSHSFCSICEQRHLVELEGQLLRIREQLEATRTRTFLRIKSFSELCDEVKESVHLEIQNRVKMILEREGKLVEEIDNIHDHGKFLCTEICHKLEGNAQRIIELLKGDFEQMKKANEKVSMFMDVHREASECLEEAENLSLGSISFVPDSLTVTTSSTSSFENQVEENTLPEQEEGEDQTAASTETLVESNLILEEPPRDNSQVNPEHRAHDVHHASDNAHSLYYRARPFLTRAKLGSSFLQRPSGVAVSPWSNEIFVVSMDTHRVYVFDIDRRKFLRSFGNRGQRAGEFMCPYGIALSTVTQEILVTDKWKHCIHVFSRDERFLRQIGSKGSGPSQFRSPESICIDKDGRIYVCDTFNNRIQVLSKEGTFIREIDGQIPVQQSPGSAPTGSAKRTLFQEPAGVAISPDSRRLVVCDFTNHRIHVFDSQEGTHLLTIGQKGSLRGQFTNPECVAVDSRGFIFVGDSGNSRLQILRPDGRFVRAFGSRGSSQGHFNWISGVAVTNKYEIVVSDFKNHCIQIF